MRDRGFTLIELLVALAIIAMLLTLAAPRYFTSVDRAREAVLQENLYLIRHAIDKFYGDKGHYPATLDELVEQRYLRRLPVDPVLDSRTGWVVVPPQDPSLGAVYEVRSGARGKALDGTPYQDW
ncbi:MAG: prepilin-type N-terminal cleavage/methylation domain-containing protein [Elusimicrobia bacterium]|nr:MAG: prepilin-type N-terminal cleavage/methylation domain-containing protein [Elusimicrobiota bacterium]